MKVYVKYLILMVGFVAAYYSIKRLNISTGITAAGAFIAYAMIEINDLKIYNSEEKEN
jgi:hypothetical protein